MSYVFTPSPKQIARGTQMFNFFKSNGWSINAICGMMGNLSIESNLNPNCWELGEGYAPYTNNTGYGLAQWTPYTTLNNLCNYYGITPYNSLESQMNVILQESINPPSSNCKQYFATSNYPIDFSTFSTSSESIEYLTNAFLANYERAGVDNLEGRLTAANYWFNYFNENSNITNGWVQQNGNWYYYINGVAQTGWVQVGTTWYYMNSTGIMQLGWVQVNNKWYYMNSTGAMQTGWIQVGGKSYFLNTDGVMQTGWVYVGTSWYYLNSTGAMQTGWDNIDGATYYFNPEPGHTQGVMVTGVQVINGVTYTFYKNGALE